jgi:hypothetical protein
MATPLLVDTDVMIDYLRGHPAARAFLFLNEQRIVFSVATLTELYAGARGEPEEAAIENAVLRFGVIPVTASIAREAGLLKRNFGKSHGVGLADAIVAATALAENAELATLNVKHYPMLKGLRPAYSKK